MTPTLQSDDMKLPENCHRVKWVNVRDNERHTNFTIPFKGAIVLKCFNRNLTKIPTNIFRVNKLRNFTNYRKYPLVLCYKKTHKY